MQLTISTRAAGQALGHRKACVRISRCIEINGWDIVVEPRATSPLRQTRTMAFVMVSRLGELGRLKPLCVLLLCLPIALRQDVNKCLTVSVEPNDCDFALLVDCRTI